MNTRVGDYSKLLTEAEAAGFEVLVTTDKNLTYQQNLTSRKIGVVSWDKNAGV